MLSFDDYLLQRAISLVPSGTILLIEDIGEQ